MPVVEALLSLCFKGLCSRGLNLLKMLVLEFYSSTAKELMLLETVAILKKSNGDFTGG